MAAVELAKRSRFEPFRDTFGLVAHGAIACAPRTDWVTHDSALDSSICSLKLVLGLLVRRQTLPPELLYPFKDARNRFVRHVERSADLAEGGVLLPHRLHTGDSGLLSGVRDRLILPSTTISKPKGRFPPLKTPCAAR